MSEFDSDAADRLEDDPILGDPDLAEPTGDELDDPELAAAEAEAEQVDLESGIGDEPAEAPVEPGAEGPEGTGIEGADDALVDDAGGDDENETPGLSDEFNTDQSPAAEQGNRVGDEMVSDDDGEFEVAELNGDELNVDALADDGTEEVSVIDGMPEVIDDSYQED
ncbi:hypothetical protein BI49514_01937 [Brevibacterium iodinum ATCC 49514]|uniref:Uncharacterized protein n=1 Tax=Brevibacterium iodinum ATCC 49514 TaxID=1255616 RepID=A0A2H1JFD8_9MICO|nr:hypothetical protein [Brevibacterium iodinum]SMX86205.1 hypothetical protein BI49514_01937 [Brevibacterium iodinum ATCC 49514]SUW11254.1 Uncharacterised protein [Brevibacterium iodinum]